VEKIRDSSSSRVGLLRRFPRNKPDLPDAEEYERELLAGDLSW
jgi:hypothetical protein